MNEKVITLEEAERRRAERMPPVPPIEAYEQDAPPRRKLKVLDYAAMQALPDPEWLVPGLIQKGTSNVMFGESNAYKSFLAADVGCCVASGAEWHGNPVQQGKVMFVATEGARGLAKLRLPAMLEYHRIPVENRVVYMIMEEINLDRPEDVDALIEALHENGTFALLIIDIHAGTIAGNENEQPTATAWVKGVQRVMRETGVTTLSVAHTPLSDTKRSRGSSHFWGSYDTRLHVEGDAELLTTTLRVQRHKDADSEGEWDFNLEKFQNSLVPVLAGQGEKRRKEKKLTAAQRLAMDALDEALIVHGRMLTGGQFPGNTKGVSLQQWRDECDRRSLTDSDKADSRKKAFQRVRASLQEARVIAVYDEHVWRCE